MTISAPEPLSSHHVLDGFSSGEPSLDDWLKRRAKANQASGASRTFVACEGATVIAYYALASSAVAVSAASGKFRRNMPDPIPVVLLARLAVVRSHHGRGIGRALFQDAARRVVRAADEVGIRGIIVHALSDQPARFYGQLGFEPSPFDPRILMVTLSDVRAAV